MVGIAIHEEGYLKALHAGRAFVTDTAEAALSGPYPDMVRAIIEAYERARVQSFKRPEKKP